jgi:glycosyltransferase involved in cell wall biosynthesis
MVFEPLVSVIIPNYNYSQYLAMAIESVLSQTYKKIEIIVVDDGSTDNSLEILSSYLSDITLVSQSNSGVSSARNAGLVKASGEYVCFLDSDDVWLPNKIEIQISHLFNNPMACVYTGIQLFEDNIGVAKFIEPQYKGNLWRKFMWNPGTSIVLLGCSNAILPTEIAKSVGGFDTRLSMSADWDFFRKVADVLDIDYDLRCVVEYRQHAKSMSQGNLFDYYKDMPIAFRNALESWLAQRKISILEARIAWLFFVIRVSLAFIRVGEFASLCRFIHKNNLFSLLKTSK